MLFKKVRKLYWKKLNKVERDFVCNVTDEFFDQLIVIMHDIHNCGHAVTPLVYDSVMLPKDNRLNVRINVVKAGKEGD